MGCISSKGSSAHEHIVEKESRKKSKKSSKRLIVSSRKEEVVVEVDGSGNDATTRLISTEVAEETTGTTTSPVRVEEEKKAVVYEKPTTLHLSDRPLANDVGASGEQAQMAKLYSIRNGVDGAQVAAGWPAWLTGVAGEAIKGWIPRKADSFEKLDKVCKILKPFLLKYLYYFAGLHIVYCFIHMFVCTVDSFPQVILSFLTSKVCDWST